MSCLQHLGTHRRENTVPPLLYLLLRAQPSAQTAQKTTLSSHSIGALAAAWQRLLSRLFHGRCLATSLYATIFKLLLSITEEKVCHHMLYQELPPSELSP
jgi:hypothetical protein